MITEMAFKPRSYSLENPYRSSSHTCGPSTGTWSTYQAREIEELERILHDDSILMKVETMAVIIKKSSSQSISW